MPESQRSRQLLVDAIACPAGILRLQACDLDLLIRVARRGRVLGRLGYLLRNLGEMDALPPVARDQFLGALTMAEARTRITRWELNRLEAVLSKDSSLRVTVLKGAAYLLQELPNTGGRISADVDLLVSRAQLPIVETMLKEAGWLSAEMSDYDERYYRQWTHEIPPLVHRERDVEVDVHFNILPESSRLSPLATKLQERLVAVENSAFFVLAAEDQLLHTMCHLMYDSDLSDTLRDLVDVALLTESFAQRNPGFWSRFIARARELGLQRPAYYSLTYCHMLLNTNIPDEVVREIGPWAPLRPVGRLMHSIVPQAIMPGDPDTPSLRVRVSRIMLYIRSHWIRMPPWLLAYHLVNKALRRRLQTG